MRETGISTSRRMICVYTRDGFKKGQKKRMNKVILMGRLTRDPNVRYTQQNSSQESMCVARYTLAVDRRGARDGQQSADFISCVAFGKNGEFAEKYLKQGTKIAATGRHSGRHSFASLITLEAGVLISLKNTELENAQLEYRALTT